MDLDATIQDLEQQLEIAKMNFHRVEGSLITVRQLKEQENAETPEAEAASEVKKEKK